TDPQACVGLSRSRRRKLARAIHELPAAQSGSLRSAAGPDRARRGVRTPNATKMTLSLRGRLLVGVIVLTVTGLVVSDVATFTSLQNFLVGRIDTQLGHGHAEATRQL